MWNAGVYRYIRISAEEPFDKEGEQEQKKKEMSKYNSTSNPIVIFVLAETFTVDLGSAVSLGTPQSRPLRSSLRTPSANSSLSRATGHSLSPGGSVRKVCALGSV